MLVFAEHYADDLEVDLEEIMLADFHTETEDESPRLVSKELVALHNELLSGNSATVNRLQQALPAAVTTSVRQTVGFCSLQARPSAIASHMGEGSHPGNIWSALTSPQEQMPGGGKS